MTCFYISLFLVLISIVFFIRDRQNEWFTILLFFTLLAFAFFNSLYPIESKTKSVKLEEKDFFISAKNNKYYSIIHKKDEEMNKWSDFKVYISDKQPKDINKIIHFNVFGVELTSQTEYRFELEEK